MALEYRHYRDNSYPKPVLTACPFCEEPLDDHAAWPMHWQRCPANPAAGGDDGE